jgi:hypothetical protein
MAPMRIGACEAAALLGFCDAPHANGAASAPANGAAGAGGAARPPGSDPGDGCAAAAEQLQHSVEAGVAAGFQLAAAAGPLCDEPLWGVAFEARRWPPGPMPCLARACTWMQALEQGQGNLTPCSAGASVLAGPSGRRGARQPLSATRNPCGSACRGPLSHLNRLQRAEQAPARWTAGGRAAALRLRRRRARPRRGRLWTDGRPGAAQAPARSEPPDCFLREVAVCVLGTACDSVGAGISLPCMEHSGLRPSCRAPNLTKQAGP